MSYADWLGRQESSDCVLQLQQANFMAASLGQDRTFNPGDPLPHGWHWLYFLQAAPRDQLGRDGHPKRGGFLPPVDLPRRMWAG
ncbi:MAG: acyl-CoA dehydrogenase, partial [Alphaproteobacteria bacterium]